MFLSGPADPRENEERNSATPASFVGRGYVLPAPLGPGARRKRSNKTQDPITQNPAPRPSSTENRDPFSSFRVRPAHGH
jgi:hypothetical protein